MADRHEVGSCGCVSIPSNTTGILERFGRFIEPLMPGLTCYCCCTDTVYLVRNNIQQLENKTNTKTDDDVNITLVTAVQYQISSANSRTAFYSLEAPRRQIEAYIDNTIRSCVPKLTLDQLFASKDDVSNAVKSELSHVMKNYGYDIINTLITDIILPANILAAMNSKNENLQLKLATIEKSEANKIAVVANADAKAKEMMLMADSESKKMVMMAGAQAEADRLKGVGIAQQRMEIAKGLEQSSSVIGEKLKISPVDSMNYVIVTQQQDMLREIGAKNKSTLLVPYSTNPADIMRNTLIQSQQIIASGKEQPHAGSIEPI